MSNEAIWNRLKEWQDKTGIINVATYVLHGVSVPLFPILTEEEKDVGAIILCTPEYVKRIKKDLGVQSLASR